MASASIEIPGYEVLRPLGSGGMSNVYLALQRSLDRKVAVKVMRRSFDPGVDADGVAHRVGTLDGLDLHNIGSDGGQILRAHGTGQERSEVEDSHTCQWE